MPSDDADPDASDGPPPPSARHWRHPSELGAANQGPRYRPDPPTAPPAADPRRHRRPRVHWAYVALSAALSAGLTVATVREERNGQSNQANQAAMLNELTPGLSAFSIGIGTTDLPVATVEVRPSSPILPGTSAVTGTVVGPGLVVTSRAAVGTSTSAEVHQADGSTAPAKVLGTDPWTDLAVLRLPDGSGPADVTELNAHSPEGGDLVAAVGRPGRGGIPVMATGEVIDTQQEAMSASGEPLSLLIQTTLDIGPGAAGGPVVDAAGQVVGIAVLTIPGPNGGSYVVPSAAVRAVVDDIVAEGQANHPWLGVQANTYNEGEEPAGVLVAEIVAGSPAAAVGMAAGDVVVSVGDVSVKTRTDLLLALSTREVGSTVAVQVTRGDAILTFEVTLSRRVRR